MGLWGTLRRLRADPIVAVGTVLAVALSLVLLAAGPIYSDAVAVGALRRSLVDAPASSTTVEVSARATTDDLEHIAATAADALSSTFDDVEHDVFESLVSGESFELPGAAAADQVDVAAFAWLEGVDERVTVTAGRLPTGDEPGAVGVAVDARAGAALGLDVGRRLRVEPRSGDATGVDIEITGWYEVIDPFAAFWTGRDRLVEPVTVSPSFRTVTLLALRSPLANGLSQRPAFGALAVPRFDDIGLDDVEPLGRRISSLTDDVNERLSGVDLRTPTEFEVVTAAPSVLAGRERTLTVARSIVFAVVLQLAVLGGSTLVLVAGLAVDARRSESAMLRARGASAGQLVGQAVFDAAIVVGPLAVVAPFLAVRLVSLLDERGALAANDLRLAPSAVPESWIVVAIASIVTVAVLSAPALRAARSADATTSRRRLAGPIQRSGIDLAILALTGATYWQLRTLGADRATTVRGRFGVDPLLVAAPTFGLIAGAFLALRVVPAGARLAERLLGGTRTVTPALAGWQLARRPHRYSRVVLLLVMAVSIGTFAAAYDATWTRSQRAQAAHDVAADGRLEPNRRTGDSIDALQLPGAIEQIRGVASASPVVTGAAELRGADDARFLAIDTSRPGVFTRDATNDRLTAGIEALQERRPMIEGVPLPGAPVAVEVAIDVPPEPEPEPEEPTVAHDGRVIPAPPPPPPFAGALTIVLVDGDGLVHRLEAGSVTVGQTVRRVDLAVAAVDGPLALPHGPLSVLAIELSSASQQARSRDVVVRFGPIIAIAGDGSRVDVPLVDSELSVRTDVLGFVDERAAIEFGSDPPIDGVTLVVTIGSSFNLVPVIYSVGVSNPTAPDRIAAVGTDAWLAAASIEVGDVVPASLGRVDDARVEIVGAVEAIPSIDPSSSDGLLVDLPSLLWSELEPGQAARPMSEYWFTTDVDAVVDEDAILRPPIEAVSVELVRERRRELTADPAALGALGALALGFGAATAFALAAFVVAVAISARERRSEFALLEALGLEARQRRRWLLIEQVVLVAVSVVVGTALGWLLSHLILPVVALSQDGSTVYPPVVVDIPWWRVVALEAAVVAALVIGAVSSRAGRGRSPVADVIRAGIDS